MKIVKVPFVSDLELHIPSWRFGGSFLLAYTTQARLRKGNLEGPYAGDGRWADRWCVFVSSLFYVLRRDCLLLDVHILASIAFSWSVGLGLRITWEMSIEDIWSTTDRCSLERACMALGTWVCYRYTHTLLPSRILSSLSDVFF